MGQIIIETPGNIKRRYNMEDSETVEELLDGIEQYATRVKTNPARLTAEDAADIRAARRARKGDLIRWEDVKETLDLD